MQSYKSLHDNNADNVEWGKDIHVVKPITKDKNDRDLPADIIAGIRYAIINDNGTGAVIDAKTGTITNVTNAGDSNNLIGGIIVRVSFTETAHAGVLMNHHFAHRDYTIPGHLSLIHI